MGALVFQKLPFKQFHHWEPPEPHQRVSRLREELLPSQTTEIGGFMMHSINYPVLTKHINYVTSGKLCNLSASFISFVLPLSTCLIELLRRLNKIIPKKCCMQHQAYANCSIKCSSVAVFAFISKQISCGPTVLAWPSLFCYQDIFYFPRHTFTHS